MNQNRSKRILLLFLILLMAAGFIFMATILILNRAPDAPEKEQDPVHVQISWWGNDGRHKYTMEGVNLFQEKNPEIDVAIRYGVWNGYEKRTKVWMESHTESDVMQINYAWLNVYSRDGEGFYDLNELKEYINLENYTEEELSYGTKNGKLNALPIAMNTHTFYYNQDILDSYGHGVPKTWDDLFTVAKKLKPEGKYLLGLAKKHLFLLMIAYYEQSFGKHFFNEDGTLAVDAEGIDYLLRFYRKLIEEHVVCPIDSFDRAMYMSGEVVGTMCWISDTKIYCDGLAETGAKVVRGSYPELPDAEFSGWYIKPATMWAISADTAHPEEAAKLLNFLLNDPDMAKLQKTEKGVPVSDAAVEALKEEGLSETNEYKAVQEMNEHQEELHLIIPNMENESIIDAFKSGADEYLYDKMTSGDAAAKILEDIQTVIAGQ
ncbi:MAG: carbohydrate ABC transporter substrate-binding protein [Eubacterium sp.]|nr:carbohydrate ABC transporter substrate-binding protein [Eubacterium sp.]